MTAWPNHVIWWQVYPLGFLGAERSALPAEATAVPRLRALEPWLDYLIALGCNGLSLGPVFASQDAREGARAFAEKRAPQWKGR